MPGSGSATRSLTPAEALDREMQELCSCGPNSTSASAAGQQQQQRPQSSTASGMACYKNPCYAAQDMAARPASCGGSPLVAQHNNLMMIGGLEASRPGSTGSTRTSREDVLEAHLAKLKGKWCAQQSTLFEQVACPLFFRETRASSALLASLHARGCACTRCVSVERLVLCRLLQGWAQ